MTDDVRLLHHERAGGGRRRAGHRQVRRTGPSSPWSTTRCARSTRARPVPRVRDVVHLPGYGGELLIAGNRALAISSGDSGDTVLSELEHRRPGAPAHRAHAEHRRPVRQRAPARPHGAGRHLLLPARAAGAGRRPAAPIPIPIEARAAAGKPLRARRAGWVPSATLRNRRTGRTRKRALVACDDVRRTPRFTGADMLTVLTIDLAQGPAGGRRRRGDDRAPTPSTRRRPASTSPPTAAGSATTPRSTASTSTAPTAPTTAPAARCRATCSTSSRCRSTRACCGWRPPTRRARRARAS